MLSYSSPPEVVLECIREILEEEKYRNKTERLRRLARDLNGPKAVREIMKDDSKTNSYHETKLKDLQYKIYRACTNSDITQKRMSQLLGIDRKTIIRWGKL